MFGYDKKSLELSHHSTSEVDFKVEVDFLGDGTWNLYDTFTVEPGQLFVHTFPSAYSAHWVRLISSTSTTATAWFTYAIAQEQLPGDYDRDGVVTAADYQVWKDHFGSTEFPDADGNGDGIVNAADYTIWRNHLGSQSSQGNASQANAARSNVPEPTGIVHLAVALGLAWLFRRVGTVCKFAR